MTPPTPRPGQPGGLALFAKRGPEHMRAIGRRGAATFWRRYRLHPTGTSQFAIIRRDTGELVAFLDGRPWARP